MAVPLALWLLVLTSVCPSTTNPISSTNVPISSISAESSGTDETETKIPEVWFSTMDTSTFLSSTDTAFTSEATVTAPEPVPIGAAIMEFINDYMIVIIIAGILLILLIVIVCTVVLVKQNYKASAYYPSSYPKKKYVDEHDKGGSAKSFSEIPEKANDDPKEEMVNSSEQLQADILTVAHNLKKKTPSKGEGKTLADMAEKGEPSQTADKEGGDITSPEVGEKGAGQTSETIENKGDDIIKAPETAGKEEGNETLSKESEQKGGKGEGEGRGNKEKDDEEGKDKETKKKPETGEGTDTNSDQLSAGDIGGKAPKSADKPEATPQKTTKEQTAEAAKTKGVDNVVSPDSQEPKEVKLAQQGSNEASNVAEPNAENLSDLEKTPLIPKPDGAPSDTKAF
ncbi:transmembrane protein 119b [Heptranchias perlo]|uniref:transmembrane protein 119b n=1 Tax=Heptranchias perlo TaxID=212740 RepID=UPI00355A0DD8